MSESILSGRGAQKRHCLVRLLAGLLLVTLPVPGLTGQGTDAHSTESTAPTGSTAPQHAGDTAGLPRITIEARTERQAVRRDVDKFVTSVVVQPEDDALYRWSKPICPLVAGLPKNWGEFILERISKAAVDAHAPLAGKVCHPDLYVVATDHADQLLKKWWVRDRVMFNYNSTGIEAVKHFIDSRQPIRAWYNSDLTCNPGDGGQGSSQFFLGPSIIAPSCTLVGSHIERTSTHSNITSAIVVIDLGRMKGMTIQQLADYIALISLADVRLDADSAPTQSILELFGHGATPQQLTRWDRALLYSLYHSDQWTVLQMSELKTNMVTRLAP